MSVHIGRLSIDYDHSSDFYVLDAERFVENFSLSYILYYWNIRDFLSDAEKPRCKFCDDLGHHSSRCACLQ